MHKLSIMRIKTKHGPSQARVLSALEGKAKRHQSAKSGRSRGQLGFGRVMCPVTMSVYLG